MLYFTSDWHIGHHNIIKYAKRPFEDIDEMANTILWQCNQIVGRDDTLIMAGDILMERDESKARELMEEIRCENLILVRGNHDEETLKHADLFQKIVGEMYFEVEDNDINAGVQAIHVCHYPILSWRNKRKYYDRREGVTYPGSIHVHGHSHGNLYNNPKWDWYYDQKVMDVSVDVTDFRPVSYLELKEKFPPD